MAWQLHYTSARSGPTGRAGFQYVAASPGAPDRWQGVAAPYLVYQPSPDDTFPESFGYDLVDGQAILVRCRYLGRDYSGRSGNFFGHVVIAEAEELEGLRPIELCDSALWESDDVAVLDELPPGGGFTPEDLGRWMGGIGAYDVLADLLDSVTDVLRRGHGRVVLVAQDPQTVARWIALVSYSLPMTLASRLSFVTYSADPDAAPHLLVGTTPAVWDSLHTPQGTVFHLDSPKTRKAQQNEGIGKQQSGGFGRAAAECWRALDLDGIDAIGELAELMADETSADPLETLSTAAASVSLTHDQGQGWSLTVLAKASAQAAQIDRPIPEGRIREAVAVRMTSGEVDLAEALEAVPASERRVLVAGAIDGLSIAEEHVRTRVLTDRTCDLLFEAVDAQTWTHSPAVAVAVLASVGRRRPELRLTVTRQLIRLADTGTKTPQVEEALTEVWSSAAQSAEATQSGWSGLRARLRGGREG